METLEIGRGARNRRASQQRIVRHGTKERYELDKNAGQVSENFRKNSASRSVSSRNSPSFRDGSDRVRIGRDSDERADVRLPADDRRQQESVDDLRQRHLGRLRRRVFSHPHQRADASPRLSLARIGRQVNPRGYGERADLDDFWKQPLLERRTHAVGRTYAQRCDRFRQSFGRVFGDERELFCDDVPLFGSDAGSGDDQSRGRFVIGERNEDRSLNDGE